VMQNIDNLFYEFNELSACADLYPDTFNSGIMVINEMMPCNVNLTQL